LALHRRAAKRDLSERDVVAALKACGWIVGKVSEKGWPDLICYRDGQLRLIEVKTGKRMLRESQNWWEGLIPVTILRDAQQAISWSKEQG
jgi:hypothetical protein